MGVLAVSLALDVGEHSTDSVLLLAWHILLGAHSLLWGLEVEDDKFISLLLPV